MRFAREQVRGEDVATMKEWIVLRSRRHLVNVVLEARRERPLYVVGLYAEHRRTGRLERAGIDRVALCEECLGPLDPIYPAERTFPDRATIAKRAPSMWRYREWLPFEGEPALSLDTGFTPLVEAPRLARVLGVARAWVKNDSVSHPSLSFKDRVWPGIGSAR